MKLIQTPHKDYFNPALVKHFYVTLDPATLSRYLVKADDVTIHSVDVVGDDLTYYPPAKAKAQKWLDNFIAALNGGDLNDQSRTDSTAQKY